ncbi:uncharacterized protein LOC115595940 [Sparus aurata]|uniref:uncharacterized protein LOC115595940 n=1 Tax=Sparus aurata TaxID=8175 RepID=UPI0011C16303|nr:uncharacterized protein LOC115595940 [Sparus aurata]
MFMAVERLLKILREKGEPALREICAELKVPMFYPVELTFQKEYYTTMSPVAQSINILQGEVEVQMGWLLPTISLLSSKLEKIKIALKHCKPLVEAIQMGIENRFGEMLRDPELVAAAILIPKFKTAWIKDDATLKIGLDYIREQLEDPSISADAGSGSSDEGDFFHILKSSHKTPSATKQLDSYLAYSTHQDSQDVSCGSQVVCQTQHTSACFCSLQKAVQHSRSHLQPKKSTASCRHF